MRRITSQCPWLIKDADLNPVGEPELTRHLVGEQQIGLVVQGQFVSNLGYIVMRCARVKGEWIPETLFIPDDPVLTITSDVEPAQSNPQRKPHSHGYTDEGVWE